MNFKCTINKTLVSRNKKKYLELTLNEKDTKKVLSEHKKSTHLIKNQLIKNPLEENVLEVKVPFRYNKITCDVSGDMTIRELKVGDPVAVELGYCGVWNIGEWSGFAWKVTKLVN